MSKGFNDPQQRPNAADAANDQPVDQTTHGERKDIEIFAPPRNNSEQAAKHKPTDTSGDQATGEVDAPADPFNPENLRVSQDFADTVGVKKVLTTVPVCRPNKQSFFRVNSDPNYRIEVAALELKEDHETYLVAPSLVAELSAEIRRVVLFTTIDRQGTLRLWPVALPGIDGRTNPWHQSALAAAELAMDSWIRLMPDLGLGAYQPYEAPVGLPEPEWPHYSFGELLKIAFKDKFINSLDHPVIKKLKGY